MTIDRCFLMAARALLALSTLSALPSHNNAPQSDANKTPIVALVERNQGRLVIRITPDPAPGTDPLQSLNLLHDRLGSKYPVVAIVDEDARVNDLWQVRGTAAKSGFDETRTFIRVHNGQMFEVTFGSAIPFSKTGPFDAKPGGQ